MSRIRCPLLLAILALTGCATAPTGGGRPLAAGGRQTVNDTAIGAIYADLKAATEAADQALQRYREGDPAQAIWRLNQARESITAVGAHCVATPGCETERVLAAQDALMGRIAFELGGGPRTDVAGEPSEATAESSESSDSDSPVTRAVPEAARTVQMLQGRKLNEMIVMNAPVKAALEEWLTWLRPYLLDTHENYQYLRHRMWPAYEKSGLPEALLFGILAKESGGKVHAISRSGAVGPLQFMPATGRRFGLGVDGGLDQRLDPAAAARANADYLNEQFGALNQNLELAIAAYNSGEGYIGRLSNGGQRDFWSPEVWSRLPPETREYVPMVLAAAWLFLHPEQYGLEFPKIDTQAVNVKLTEATTINQLTVCLGQDGNPRGWFRTLRNLNPRYEPETLIPLGTELDLPRMAAASYSKNCLKGPRLALANDLHEAYVPRPTPAPQPVRTVSRTADTAQVYVVRKGETLAAIARKFHCADVHELAHSNGLTGPSYTIRVGQRLKIGSCH